MRIALLILVLIDACTAKTLYASLKEEALSNFDKQKHFFRWLHMHAELGFAEQMTTQAIQKEIQNLGVKFTTNWGKRKRADGSEIGGFGVVAELGAGQSPCVGLRAEIDALPVTEQTKIEYKSINKEVMHASGHDAHTAMLLGAIQILKPYENTINGTIRFLFQPAGEGAGAECMVNEGVLTTHPAVESMFAVRVKPSLPTGTIASTAGALLAGAQAFSIRIDGIGGHPASPHLVRDPVPVAAVIIQAIQNIVSRELSPTQHEHDGIISVTSLQSPQSFNVIPPYVDLKGTIRTLDFERMAFLEKRLTVVTESIATSFEQTATVVFSPIAHPSTFNDRNLYVWTSETLKPDFNITDMPPMIGAEDFSYYATKVPSNLLYLGTGSGKSPPTNFPLHSDRFAVDEAVLPIGSALLAQLALTRIEALNVKREYAKDE